MDLDPQIMLFSIAMDLALLFIVYLKLWRAYALNTFLCTISLLALGSLVGLSIYYTRSDDLLSIMILYEVLFPLMIAYFIIGHEHPSTWKWVTVLLMVSIPSVSFGLGWTFKGPELLVYEMLVYGALAALIIVILFGERSIEEEKISYLLSVSIPMVFGPGYGYLWTGLGVHDHFFTVYDGIAMTSILFFQVRHVVVFFGKPKASDRSGKVRVFDLKPGMYMVPPEKMETIEISLSRDLARGRCGLWISMEPVAQIRNKRSWGRDNEGNPAPFFAAQLSHARYIEKAVDPSDIPVLRRSLAEFIRRSVNGVVVLKDAHYIVSNTNIWDFRDVLEYLDRLFSKRNFTLIVETDLLEAWEMRELKAAGLKEISGFQTALGFEMEKKCHVKKNAPMVSQDI